MSPGRILRADGAIGNVVSLSIGDRCCVLLLSIVVLDINFWGTQFFYVFLDAIVDMKDEYIYMPQNITELNRTTVVTVMHLYGNSKIKLINTNAKNSAKKTKLGSKLKKLGLDWSKKHLKEAYHHQKMPATDW